MSIKDWNIGVEEADAALGFPAILLSFFVGKRCKYNMGAAQALGWFPKRTPRQQMSVPEGAFSIEEDDIHIALQSKVLKAVVEYNYLG
jgi:hypothetical protein